MVTMLAQPADDVSRREQVKKSTQLQKEVRFTESSSYYDFDSCW